MYKHFIFLFLFAFALSSCRDNTEYTIDSTLDEYLQRFLAEGATRGRTFDLQKNGFIIEFGDLEDDVAGRCYYEDPVRVVIDQEYWDSISEQTNAEDLRENLVFHELGHGILNRGHNNDYLPNGDWKSMMCGGTEKDDRSWNINFRGIRREYYLDELFDINTATPYWATKVFTDSVTETLVVEDNFEGISSAYWPTGTKSTYTASVVDGVYSFENKDDLGIIVTRAVPINSEEDFYFEAKFMLENSDDEAQFGIVLGNGDTPISMNYFLINNNQRMFIGHTYAYGWYTELLQSGLETNDYNILGIRKIASDIYYYINGNCVYYDQFSINDTGTSFGFEVAGNTTLLVDYFHLYSSSSLKSGVIIDNSIQEPRVIDSPKGIWINK